MRTVLLRLIERPEEPFRRDLCFSHRFDSGPQPFRQIVNPNRTGFRISIAQRVNDSVFQLADVPGPGGLAQQALDFRIHLRDGNLAQVGIFLYQVPGQRENVPGTVAQRRHFNREDFETVQKVFAKEAGRDPSRLTATNQLAIYVGRNREETEKDMRQWLSTEWDTAAWSESTIEHAIHGSAEQCIEQLRAHVKTGVNRIILIPYRYQPAQVERIAKEVMAKL